MATHCAALKWIMALLVATHSNDDLPPRYFIPVYHYSSCDSDFGTVNSEIFAKVSFSRNFAFACAKFRENKPLVK